MTLFLSVLTAIFSGLSMTTASSLPSECYALNKENYLYNFTDKIGRELELEGEFSDLVLRLCVDVQNRSNNGYVNFGRFLGEDTSRHESADVDIYQEYKNGDLRLCEHSGNALMGRETEVRMVCGRCPNEASCKDEFGCICNATYHRNSCKAKVLAALNCGERGPRIYQGFNIGFQPRGSEVVKNGLTQRAFRDPFHGFCFESHQKRVSLYMTSTLGLTNVGKPEVQVQPPKGLLVEIASKASNQNSSGLDTITLLEVDWRCRKIRGQPYKVKIRFPIGDYDPVDFHLCKECKKDEIQMEAAEFNMKVFATLSLVFVLMVAVYGFLCITNKFFLQKKSESNVPLINKSMKESESNVPLINKSVKEDHDHDAAQPAIEVPMV